MLQAPCPMRLAHYSMPNPPITINLMSPYYQKAFAYLQQKGRETYGNFFLLYPNDTQVIGKLLAWFLRDKATADLKGINLQKGILLSGPVGSGKTSLMNLMRHFSREQAPHFMKPCRDIAFEFEKDGFEILRRYSGITYLAGAKPKIIKTFCFDDLGTEQILTHYGKECNVMAEIILSRYENFTRHHRLTHFTTNLSADEIEEIYGPRVRSRLREMCNLIAFPAETPDKRK
ncbi:ATPase [Marinilabilia salmonicolor]|nr:ATPase [Marinilabilia salmonicolor]